MFLFFDTPATHGLNALHATEAILEVRVAANTLDRAIFSQVDRVDEGKSLLWRLMARGRLPPFKASRRGRLVRIELEPFFFKVGSDTLHPVVDSGHTPPSSVFLSVPTKSGNTLLSSFETLAAPQLFSACHARADLVIELRLTKLTAGATQRRATPKACAFPDPSTFVSAYKPFNE